MPWTAPASTGDLPLDTVPARLARHPAVDAVAVLGSFTIGTAHAASDYDLLIVLREMPVPLGVGLTTIGGRLADLIFLRLAAVAQVATTADSIVADSPEGKLVRWMETARIALDRSGYLARIQARARTDPRLTYAGPADRYRAWFSTNFNVQHNRRMLAAPDPVYRTALDIRLLYSLHEVWLAYFQTRGLPTRGEKAGVRYLLAHDPAFLARFQACLAEPDRGRKMGIYEELAQAALAPLGGLWPPAVTAMQLDGDAAGAPGAVEQALAFWEALVAAPPGD
jgi:predicted nucleotidyltransferase